MNYEQEQQTQDFQYEPINFVNGIYYPSQVAYDAEIEYYDDGDEEFTRKRAYEQ